jgi:hypothetical protein
MNDRLNTSRWGLLGYYILECPPDTGLHPPGLISNRTPCPRRPKNTVPKYLHLDEIQAIEAVKFRT